MEILKNKTNKKRNKFKNNQNFMVSGGKVVIIYYRNIPFSSPIIGGKN